MRDIAVGYAMSMTGAAIREAAVDTAVHYPHLSMDFGGRKVAIVRLACGPIDEPVPPHAHGSGCYELHYNVSGDGTAILDGERHRIGPGTLYVTGPGVMHAQIPDAEGPLYEYCVNLSVPGTSGRPSARSSSRGSRTRIPDGDGFPDESLAGGLASLRRFVGEDRESLGPLFRRLFVECRERRIGWRRCIAALTEEILIGVVRNGPAYRAARFGETPVAVPVAGAVTDAEDGGDPVRLSDGGERSLFVDQYFLGGYDSQSLEDLAKRLSLSTRQTQREIIRYYGMTFREKSAESRMDVAGLLLDETDEPIAAIAGRVGYASPEHFSAAFRRRYGMSPSAYRMRRTDG